LCDMVRAGVLAQCKTGTASRGGALVTAAREKGVNIPVSAVAPVAFATLTGAVVVFGSVGLGVGEARGREEEHRRQSSGGRAKAGHDGLDFACGRGGNTV